MAKTNLFRRKIQFILAALVANCMPSFLSADTDFDWRIVLEVPLISQHPTIFGKGERFVTIDIPVKSEDDLLFTRSTAVRYVAIDVMDSSRWIVGGEHLQTLLRYHLPCILKSVRSS